MSSDGFQIDKTHLSDHQRAEQQRFERERYEAKRNRLTAGAAVISLAMIGLSWLGAHYRDRRRQESAAAAVLSPATIGKPDKPAPALLQFDNLPADAAVSVDSRPVAPESFTGAPGPHTLVVRAAGYRDFETPVNFTAGSNRFQIKLCPLKVDVPVPNSPKPAKILDLTGRYSAWQPCDEITCEDTQADMDRRAGQIVAKTCSNWDKAAHRRRGRSASEDGAGLVTEVGCEVSINSPRCRLHIIKGACEVLSQPVTLPASKPFICPAMGALEFSRVSPAPP